MNSARSVDSYCCQTNLHKNK